MTEWKSVKEFENLVSFKEKGDSTEGTYQGSFNYTAKNGQNYLVHKIINPAGQVEEFFGSGQLNHLLSKIEKGDMIKIVYEGLSEEEIETDFGKKRLHQYNVLKAK